jgi:hypothetical protein
MVAEWLYRFFFLIILTFRPCESSLSITTTSLFSWYTMSQNVSIVIDSGACVAINAFRQSGNDDYHLPDLPYVYIVCINV